MHHVRNALGRGKSVMPQPALANIIAPMMVFWMGWQVLWWIAAGIAVELVLIKLVFRIEWLRALKLGLLVNLVSTAAGAILVVPGPLLLIAAYTHVIFWILQLLASAFFSAHLHRVTADFFLVPIHDPFMFRWLFLVNLIGIGIASSCRWWIALFEWQPLC